MEQIAQIAECFRGIVSLIVDCPEDVQISPIEHAEGFILKITVARRDIGKVIGKMGHTARALRHVVQAIGVANKIRITLDIMDSPPPPEQIDVEIAAVSDRITDL